MRFTITSGCAFGFLEYFLNKGFHLFCNYCLLNINLLLTFNNVRFDVLNKDKF